MRPKTICTKCGKEISNNNFQKHYNACKGPKPPKKIRGIDYDPNWGYKNGTRKGWNKDLTKETDERVLNGAIKFKNTISRKIENGERWGCITPEYYNSKKFKEACSRGGGYRENAGRSKKFHVFDSFGKLVCLQSTYELECSIILNDLCIDWIRPKALKYDNKNYFADFYLPEFNIWLDPKNDYKILCDKEKIQAVIEQNNIKLYVLEQKQITKEFILSMLS